MQPGSINNRFGNAQFDQFVPGFCFMFQPLIDLCYWGLQTFTQSTMCGRVKFF